MLHPLVGFHPTPQELPLTPWFSSPHVGSKRQSKLQERSLGLGIHISVLGQPFLPLVDGTGKCLFGT